MSVQIPDSLGGLTVAEQYATVEQELSALRIQQRDRPVFEYGARLEYLRTLRAELFKRYTDPHGKKTYA